MRFRVLGPVEIESEDGPVVVSGQRLRALLTALLLQPNSVVPTDRLVEALGGQDLPESPANALHQVVTRLRARLRRWAECVRTGPGGYVLVAPDGSIDAEVFEGTYRRARSLMGAGSDRADPDQANPDQAARVLDSALALWRGHRTASSAAGSRSRPRFGCRNCGPRPSRTASSCRCAAARLRTR